MKLKNYLSKCVYHTNLEKSGAVIGFLIDKYGKKAN